MPAGSAVVQLRDEGGLGVFEVSAKHLGEEVVVAVPLPAVVQRDEEELVPLDVLQQFSRVSLPGEGLAQQNARLSEVACEVVETDLAAADVRGAPAVGSRAAGQR